jgi:hypothetical protein
MFAVSTVTLLPEQIVILVLAPIAVAAIVVLAFRKNLWKIAERRKLAKMATRLNEWGLTCLADVVQCLSDGDLAGAVKEGHYLDKQLEKDDTARLLLGTVGKKQLSLLLADPSDRRAVLATVAQYAAANPALVQAAGFTIATVAPPAVVS